MKLKYKNKHYCISDCAKDKFEEYILTPIIVTLSIVTFFTAIFIFFSTLGFIAEGILVSFFNFQAFMKYGSWTSLGASITIIVFILTAICMFIADIFSKIHNYIQDRLSEEYSKRYKPECKLFVECKE